MATTRAAIACALGVALLAGCGGSGKDKPATQTAAKVNKEEITVHQINFALQQRNVRPEQADAASKQVLERLIDQELALQKAGELKLDRDPRVVQQLDAMRREIISRAYFEKVGSGAPKPTAEEVKRYYDENPALFADRRIYSLQEIAIEAKPEQMDELRKQLDAAKNVGDFVAWLRKNDFRFVGNQIVRPAEQLPLSSLPTLAKMKDGDSVITPGPRGAQVIVLANSRREPVSEERARPAIEQFLLNQKKRKVVADDVKALRTSAAIQYVGKFAHGAASAPAVAEPSPAEVAASAAKGLESAVNQGLGLKPNDGSAPAPAVVAPPTPSASAIDSSNINKGLGLKSGAAGTSAAPPPGEARSAADAASGVDTSTLEKGLGLK
jgi:EpsD family peptidyl-prolyl cis-trans isomerase